MAERLTLDALVTLWRGCSGSDIGRALHALRLRTGTDYRGSAKTSIMQDLLDDRGTFRPALTTAEAQKILEQAQAYQADRLYAREKREAAAEQQAVNLVEAQKIRDALREEWRAGTLPQWGGVLTQVAHDHVEISLSPDEFWQHVEILRDALYTADASPAPDLRKQGNYTLLRMTVDQFKKILRLRAERVRRTVIEAAHGEPHYVVLRAGNR